MILDAGQAAVVFSFLSQDTDTELLANPRVVTTDNSKARISIATQYPIPNFAFSEQTASLQISGFDYKDIGIILNVLPRINKNDFVTLEVTPEASSSTENATLQSGGGARRVDSDHQHAHGDHTVLIKSGNTLAIGGLMRQDISRQLYESAAHGRCAAGGTILPQQEPEQDEARPADFPHADDCAA